MDPYDDPENCFTDSPAFLTVEELARLLRCNVKTAYGAIERGEIPGVLRLGRMIRIRRAALLDSPGKGASERNHER